MNDIVYPVILTHQDKVIYVGIPDLKLDNFTTYGKDINEAVKFAKEVITLNLLDYEEEGKKFPKASDIKELKKNLNENQEIIYVSLWLPYEKALTKTIYKKKTLSIPSWLDMLATAKNINFSQVLQKALKEELGIK